MTWKSNYFAKHIAQKGLNAVPGLFKLQEWFKGVSGRWDQQLTDEFFHSTAMLRARQFERAELRVPRHAVEQGTGWHGRDLVFLHLAGVQSIDTYDTRPWLQPKLLHRCFQQASIIAEGALHWSAVDPDVVWARARELEAAPEGTLEELLGRIDTRYHVTTSFERPQLASGSCDLLFSDSVLQRMKPTDLGELVTEARRFLAPGGRQHHVIDCKDFHSITDPRVPELYYLSFSPTTWGALTSTYLNYQNRWRKSDFVDLFKRAGSDVSLEGVLRSEDNLRWLRDRAHLLHLGRVEPLEEVAITRFELSTGRPAAVRQEAGTSVRALAG